MITEDPLEPLAIQWFQDTDWENIEHRTSNIERRSEEKRSLVEAVWRLNPKQEPSSRPSPMKTVVEEVVA